MGADAVVDVQEESACLTLGKRSIAAQGWPSAPWTAAAGGAASRWFAAELRRLGPWMLYLVGVSFILTLLGSLAINLPGLAGIGVPLAPGRRSGAAGRGRPCDRADPRLAFRARPEMSRLLEWPQLLRPAAVALVALGTKPLAGVAGWLAAGLSEGRWAGGILLNLGLIDPINLAILAFALFLGQRSVACRRAIPPSRTGRGQQGPSVAPRRGATVHGRLGPLCHPADDLPELEPVRIRPSLYFPPAPTPGRRGRRSRASTTAGRRWPRGRRTRKANSAGLSRCGRSWPTRLPLDPNTGTTSPPPTTTWACCCGGEKALPRPSNAIASPWSTTIGSGLTSGLSGTHQGPRFVEQELKQTEMLGLVLAAMAPSRKRAAASKRPADTRGPLSCINGPSSNTRSGRRSWQAGRIICPCWPASRTGSPGPWR